MGDEIMLRVTNEIKIKNTTNIINDKSPSISGIITQECKGKLWVDHIETPRIALVESYATGSFAFTGIYDSTLDFLNLSNFLRNELFPQLKKNGYHHFEFSIDSEMMRTNLLDMFQDKSIQSEKECSYQINTIPKKALTLPAEYHIRKIDESFWSMLLEGKYEHEEFLRIRLLESWHSIEDFMKKSIAYCTIYDNRIVAVMVGTACYNNVIAIDIETEEKHRRMGLAYSMAVEFIADCLHNNYVPQWDCIESNPNSHDLAKKLGFEKMNENTVYWFPL